MRNTIKWLMAVTAVAAGTYCQAQAPLRQGDPKLSEIWSPFSRTRVTQPIQRCHHYLTANLMQPSRPPPNGKLRRVVIRRRHGHYSNQGFGDCQLHIEWRTPAEVKGDGQGRGNSGIFLMGRYELQVLDNYNNRTYSNGQAGSIYKQLVPLANACRPPGEWQVYDVIWTAPRFNQDSTLKSPARITVIHNGVLVQNNATLWGGTQYIGIPTYDLHSDAEPIVLQDHGNPISFRNIWIRPLK